MKWLMEMLSVVLLLAALVLAVLLWRAASDQRQLSDELAGRTKAAADLRVEITSRKARTREAARDPVAIDPRLATVTRELNELSAKKQAARFRQNALQSYIAGFDALHLPPETLAEAKHIILERWRAGEAVRDQAVARARANGGTASLTEELESSLERLQSSEDEKLTALLGREAVETLHASTRKGTIDWEIGTDMWDGGAPLTPDQLHALALAQERVNYQRTFWSFTPKSGQVADPGTGLSPQDNAFLAAAAPSLTPPQQEILRRSLVENNQYLSSMRAFGERQRALWQAAAPAKK